MTRSILTIVIVNYKTGDLVCQAVQSAKDHSQLDQVGVSIIVVDNGSNDGSIEMIRKTHPDIELIEGGDNLGFAKGNNLALAKIKTPYAMLLNSDAFLQTGTLWRLVDFMNLNPDVGVCGPRIINPDGTDQDYPCHFPTIFEMIRRALKGPQFPAQKKGINPILMDRIHGCCLMTRRSVLEKVGLLDEQFFLYDEDMDWCLRCAKAGWKLALLPDVKVIHLGGQTSGRAPSGIRNNSAARSFNPRMIYELRKSRYILFRKYKSFPEIFILKIFTDIFMIAGCFLSIPGLISTRNRETACKKLKAYSSIIMINPFRMKVKAP